MNMQTERIGVARSRAIPGMAVLFHRGRVKLSTKYRVWPVPGDDNFLELDPSEWREKYVVVQEFKTTDSGRPT